MAVYQIYAKVYGNSVIQRNGKIADFNISVKMGIECRKKLRLCQ